MGRNEIVKSEDIQKKISTVRCLQVVLDSDLAKIYGVETKVLNQAVKRNKERFPDGFMLQLSEEEHDSLRSQMVNLKLALGFLGQMK